MFFQTVPSGQVCTQPPPAASHCVWAAPCNAALLGAIPGGPSSEWSAANAPHAWADVLPLGKGGRDGIPCSPLRKDS